MNMRLISVVQAALLMLGSAFSFGQSAYSAPKSDSIDYSSEAFQLREFYSEVLANGQCHEWLRHLTKEIGPRLSGSDNAEAATVYCSEVLREIGADTVWLQPCVVPKWIRGDKEVALVTSTKGGKAIELNCLALGNTVGTGEDGITGELIEVQSLDELKMMEDSEVVGKVVFFNRPMDGTLLNTFHAYGRAVDQRSRGPIEAARKGAVAAVVRSMTTRIDDHPHTGSTSVSDEGYNIPAIAISTADADMLGGLLKTDDLEIYIRTTCRTEESVTSYNVIGEVYGSDLPEEIILVGGHLDSWDVGQGAHDDGSGCVQSMEVLRALLSEGYRPRRTLRCVLFMNEENGLQGARTYAAESGNAGEFHLAAIESDAGGFTPRGFSCEAADDLLDKYIASFKDWWSLIEPYDLFLKPGGSGADISQLKSQGGILIGLRPDTQRYFDYHHATTDVFEAVNERELKLGAAAMTSLVYMLDRYGHKVE